MKARKLICAALSALFLWTGCAAGADEKAAEASAKREEEGNLPAEQPSLEWMEDRGLELGDSAVSYPALREGILPEALRDAINARILEDGAIPEYTARISQLISGGKLRVSWRGSVLGPVFSFAVAAEGAVVTLRSSYVWTGGNIDLQDGREVSWEELFSDPEAARERMETYLEESVAPELSAHLLSSDMTPLPERFRMTERGIVWMYPRERLSTLSDRAGDVLIPWTALREELDASEEGLPARMGIMAGLRTEEDAEKLKERAAAGEIPGIPARLGDSVQELTDRWRMLTDPDVDALGRVFALEGAEFRGVYLLTDYLSESWEESRVEGIRVEEGGVYGLIPGETAREDWLRLLGEPDHTLEMDAELAEAYRTVPGKRDYYVCGAHRLQLQADGTGTLVSVTLSE